MKVIQLSFLLGLLFFLIIFIWSHLMHNSVNDYEKNKPEMDIKEYFNGPIHAWGIVQDWRGRVVKQFDIDMVGKWEGNKGTLAENFHYYDGKKQERLWTIQKLDNERYEGTASDVIGKALGKIKGNAAQWSYVMNLEVGKTNYRIRFDDWMWAMHKGVLINRSYLKKFGFTVAELTIFMQKQR